MHLPNFTDERGSLVFGELGAQLPFAPVRYFAITDAPANAVRGMHAHLSCQQLVVVLRGSCRMVLVDGFGRDEVTLDSPTLGLHIPAMVWGEQTDFAPGTVVLVLASDKYDPSDYVRSFTRFMEMVAAK